MSQVKWTKAQQDAIETDGGELLVSAAAGSGKTAVLTQRAIRLMTGENPIDADRLLIATFTNAAAGEMRRRIRQKLAELLARQPDDSFIRRQARLLDSAEIGTVHAFCQRLIRQHFERLNLPPNFRLLGEEEARLLRGEVAEAVAQEAYSAGDAAYLELVELLSAPGGDSKVAQTVMKIYDTVSSHPFYRDWMDEKLALYSGAGGAAASVWGRALTAYAKSAIDYCLVENARLMDDCSADDVLTDKYLPSLKADKQMLEGLDNVLQSGGWDEIAETFERAAFMRLGVIRGEHPGKDEAKNSRDGIKDIIKKLKESFTLRESDFEADIEDLLPKITCLFELVKQFDDDYALCKRARSALDFTDLEQMAVKLLVERSDTGGFIPTEIALEVSERYDAVMVDEYQDINAAQDAIFRAISRSGNLFMVGDVKQSIYRFRQASPQLFIDKMDKFLPIGNGFPALIRLANNFRSRSEVTRVVNGFFALLMSREVGEIDYNRDEYLVPAEGPPMPDARAELILIDNDAGGEDESALELEAEYVAGHIRELIDSGTLVRDGDGFRPVKPGDIALLLSAPRTSAMHFIRALGRAGVPCVSGRRPEFLASYEIAPVVGLLTALDNPLRELELAAALISPLFGLLPDHLARLRIDYGGDGLYAALRAAAETKDAPFVETYELFAQLRRLSLMLPPHELITNIYERTGYEVTMGMTQGGARRLATLRLLVDYAADEAERGRRTLADFVGYLDRLARRGQDLAAAPAGEQSGVSVMSIHQSKGLEYPVVYLCHMGKAINRADLRERTILHPDFGFASVRRDPKLLIQYDSLPFIAVKLESERALMSEELRKLYVAMTRARDILVMTCVCKNARERIETGGVPLTPSGILPPFKVRSAASMADWLMLCLPHMQAGGECNSLKVSIVSNVETKRVSPDDSPEIPSDGAEVDDELLSRWQGLLDFKYPFERACKTPAKLSVSDLTKTDPEARFLRRPGFLSKSGEMSPTEKGNAVHRFMQLCDYHKAAADPQAECRRLLDKGLLSVTEAGAVDTRRIRDFFSGPLGQRVLNSPRVLREFGFVAPAGRDLLGPYLPELQMGDEEMMVQGIADCIFFEGERAVLLDYKTDYAASPDILKTRYGAQIEVYRALLPAFLGAEISESYIYSFYLALGIGV